MPLKNRTKLGPQARSATFDNGAVDLSKRTVALSFSSEDPYERYWGVEILDHQPEAVDLSRLNDGAPLLWNHKWDEQIGVIEEARIDDDKVGRAVVRFGNSVKANEIYSDVIDGIITKVSVGYSIKEMVLEKTSDEGPDEYRVTRWFPHEVSLCSIAADNGIGVGRQAEIDEIETVIQNLPEEEAPMPAENKEVKTPEVTPEVTPQETPKAPEVDVAEVQRQALEQARKDNAEILAIGKLHKVPDMAEKAIADGTPLNDFRIQVLEKVAPSTNTPVPDMKTIDDQKIGMNEKEKRHYSLIRAINAAASGDWSNAGLEKEASQAVAQRVGRDPQGFFMPYDAFERELSVGTDTAGGHLVADDLQPGMFIDLLRNRMVTRQLGARVIDGLVGDISIPKMDGSSTGYWLSEGQDTTLSDQSFTQVAMTPKTVAGATVMSRKLRIQSSLAIEQLVQDDIVAVLARAMDLAAIHGTGASNQPLGILGTSGIGSVAMGTDGGALTWDKVVQLETEIAVDNADIGSMGYLTNPKVRGAAKTIEKSSGTGMFLWGNDGVMNGYPTAVSNQVSSTLDKGTSTGVCSALVLGVWSQLMIGIWGGNGFDILVDPYTGGLSGDVRVIVFHDCDIAVRYPEAFAAILDITTA